MNKKIISVLTLVLIMMLTSFATAFAANEAPIGDALYIKSAEYSAENEEFTIIVANKADFVIEEALVTFECADTSLSFVPAQSSMAVAQENMVQAILTDVAAGGEKEIIVKGTVANYDKDSRLPVVNASVRYAGDMTKIKVNEEKAQEWLKNGAQPTETVKSLLTKTGIIK